MSFESAGSGREAGAGENLLTRKAVKPNLQGDPDFIIIIGCSTNVQGEFSVQHLYQNIEQSCYH